MSLETYTTPEARKMLEYFGWPEHFQLKTGKEITYFGPVVTCESHALAILQAHMWGIIGERFDYEFENRRIKYQTPLGLVLFPMGYSGGRRTRGFCAPDLDTLLVKTCTWIMENENG